MKKTLLAVTIAAFTTTAFADAEITADNVLHYDGKPATEHTQAANKAFAKTLPWDDVTAFDRTERGLIAELVDDAAAVRNQFPHMSELDLDNIPDTVNPSLFRQGMLNYAANGLYKVVDGVWQVRGADISNLTIYQTDNGYLLHDPLLTEEAAHAAWEFAKQHLPKINGEHKVTGIIYSHSHQDHFGGVRGVIDDDFDGIIIAPDGFMEAIADEALIGGNAMSRRTQYQYGTTLPTNTRGIVDNALGLAASKGEVTLIPHNYEVKEREEWVTIDGLEILFINMPHAEAPSEMINWIPKYKALNTAELTFDGQHNIYSFRGAKTRDSLLWTKYLHEMKMRFADEAVVLHAAHSAPVWNDEGHEIGDYLTMQRDSYGFLHNQSMRLANQGVTVNDVGRVLEEIVPQSQLDTWHTNGYHGSYSHNARAIVNFYLGYFDMNPVNVNPLMTQDRSAVYVENWGADAMYDVALNYFNDGQYQEASQLLNDILQVDATNDQARQLLADSFEQQGYQSETMAWRNTYLQGAYELRTGNIKQSIAMSSPDIVANTPTEGFLDFFAVTLNGPKLAELGLDFSLSLVHPDLDEHFYAEVSNGNFTAIPTAKLVDADVTIYINKEDLTRILIEEVTFEELVKSEEAKLKGDGTKLMRLLDTTERFTPDFDIVPMPVS